MEKIGAYFLLIFVTIFVTIDLIIPSAIQYWKENWQVILSIIASIIAGGVFIRILYYIFYSKPQQEKEREKMERYRKQREHEAHQQKIKIEKAIEVQRAHEVEIRSWAQRLPAEQLRFEYEKRERKIVKLERELKEFENWANKPGNNWDDDYAPAKQGRRELYNHLSRLREEKEIIEQVLDERWR